MATVDMQCVITRDRRIVLLCLFIVTALAWIYLALTAQGMSGAMSAPSMKVWTSIDFYLMFVMWAVMMLGMMFPSASPMILMFARINRNQTVAMELSPSLVPVWIFVAGYVVVWSGFSLIATIAQWAFQYFGVLSPMMVSVNAVFGGIVLVAAGVYQWTPLKQACLRHCQTPLGFLMTRWRDGTHGAFQMGLAHGAYCVGCCWALMALVFVGGVMNLVWIAMLAVLVLAEKIAPPGPWLSRIVGIALAFWGGWVLATAYFQ
jgi:predicted metal-binding membrane protein